MKIKQKRCWLFRLIVTRKRLQKKIKKLLAYNKLIKKTLHTRDRNYTNQVRLIAKMRVEFRQLQKENLELKHKNKLKTELATDASN